MRAVFAMAPGLAQAFLPDSLARIDIPVPIVAGAANEVAPVKSDAEFFAAKIPHAELTIFAGALAQRGHRTPSGQRCWRTKAKRLASSIRAGRFARLGPTIRVPLPRAEVRVSYTSSCP
jgi:pimeloyl-ACP methyl ester carboxylesterase